MKNKMVIPNDAEFARAKRLMESRLQKGAEVKSMISKQIPGDISYHDIWVWIAEEKTSEVSFIFPSDLELRESATNGVRETIRIVAIEAVNSFGINKIDVSFHSHERVLKKFNGNYDRYFR